MSDTPRSRMAPSVLVGGSLVVVPVLVAGLWAALGPRRADFAHQPSEEQIVEGPEKENRAVLRDERQDHRRIRERPDVTVSGQDEPSSRERSLESTWASPAAERDAARIVRFDNNARAFDERISAFHAERGQLDAETSSGLRAALEARLGELHPGLVVDARCTTSVCIVDLSSEDSVGTMIARIAPWLRRSSGIATGDPEDASDERGMRLALDKSDALAFVDQPSGPLP